MEERNPIIWDVETDRLNEIAFQLHIESINRINQRLYDENKDYRASYSTLSDFIKGYVTRKDKHIKEARIIIRKDKINRIKNKQT